MKRVLIIGGILGFCLIIFILITNRKSNNLGSTEDFSSFTNGFVKSLSEGKSEETYTLLTDHLKSQISEDSWNTQVSDGSSKFADKCDSTEEQAIQEPKATYGDNPVKRVICRLQYDGTAYILNLVLVKTDKGMRVDDTAIYADSK